MKLNDLLYKGFYDFFCKEKLSLKEEKIKVIFNNPATILFVGDKKFVVKSYQETFDEEKGLCMALLRYFGISYLDLKRILKKSNLKQEELKKESVDFETTHLVEIAGPIVDIISPKGKKKGRCYNFFVGDSVVVRDCNNYSYTTNANAKKLLNKILVVSKDKSDFTGTCYVVNGVEFSASELEPYKI